MRTLHHRIRSPQRFLYEHRARALRQRPSVAGRQCLILTGDWRDMTVTENNCQPSQSFGILFTIFKLEEIRVLHSTDISVFHTAARRIGADPGVSHAERGLPSAEKNRCQRSVGQRRELRLMLALK